MHPLHALARTVFAMALAFSPLAASAQSDAADIPLPAYKDKSRVLLVFAPNAKDAAYIDQGKLWQAEKAGFEERQLVVVPVLADAKKAAREMPETLQRQFGIDAKAFAVVLLGKDGHDAYRTAKPVKAEALYEVIDAMPMRKAEMKRQQTTRPIKPGTDHDE